MIRQRRRALALAGLALCGIVAAAGPATAQEAVSFRNQKIAMIIGFATGGGTDATGRLLAPFLAKHLPGQPSMIVQNMPGAFGMTSFNFLLQQTKPDGLYVSMGANSQVDPVNYRKAAINYDPRKFHYVGGIGRGGYALIINAEAEKRLYDKSARPVVMGSVGGWPRAAMQVTVWGIEFLGWNARWVTGYQGTNDLMLALDRGEIDMTSTGNIFQLNQLVDSGRFRILNQSGSLENGKFVGRPDLRGAPVFADVMAGKIKDPLGQRAFDYWIAINATDKFLALVPGTPAPIVEAYREAFAKAVRDPELLGMGQAISDEFAPMSHSDMEMLVNTLAETPPEVVDYLTRVLAKQGLKVAD
jgi:tripartite-type tricarboxylate transporter receptor subunit TctC